MRKGIAAIAVAGSIFALTAAGASGLSGVQGDSIHVTTSNGATVTSTQCVALSAMSYGYDSPKQNITSITLEATDASCADLTATVTVNGTTFDAATAFPATATGGKYTIVLSDSAAVALSNDVVVSIT